MSFRHGGAGKRRDTNEPAIIEALRLMGAYVYQVSGDGLPDLLVLWQSRWTPLEIKTTRGKLTASQMDIPWPVVRSVSEALAAIGVT